MISNKVLITYKRKRLSANVKPAIIKSDSSVKIEGEHCFRCGNVDVNENLLVCHSCFGSYHIRCIESSSEYVPEDSWLCSACTKNCNTEGELEGTIVFPASFPATSFPAFCPRFCPRSVHLHLCNIWILSWGVISGY